MRKRFTSTLDEGIRDRLPQEFLDAVDFHGHLCPGLAIGYRAATIALERLGIDAERDEELLGIVENDACGVDAFQLLTSCTLGKGNLIYRDYGKHAFTLIRRDSGQGVRVAMRPGASAPDPEQAKLRERISAGVADEDDRSRYYAAHIGRTIDIVHMAAERFATVSDVEIALPTKARIFESFVCSVCGEGVMEPRGRLRDGEPCCIPCSTHYGRGWEING